LKERYYNLEQQCPNAFQYFKGNYGLYFTIWVRLMGTFRPGYNAAFEALKKKEKLKSK
jgi:sterol desaturase/sphingolipid hydroxylase (fatty acid hydroxylase superfamily)